MGIRERQQDAGIDAIVAPDAVRDCFCTGACDPAHERYEGACVSVPRYTKWIVEGAAAEEASLSGFWRVFHCDQRDPL